MKKTIFIIPLVFLFASCEWLKSHQTGDVVAQVDDKVLYERDIQQLVPIGTSSQDSLRIVYQYIQQWATNQLLYKKAVQNSGKKDEIEAMVEDYRRLLYVHEYEQNLLQRRNTDTIPTDSIKAYYDAHHDIFRLKDNVVKGIFIIIPKNSRDEGRLIEWLRNPTEENQEKLETFAYEKSVGFSNFINNWQNFNEIKMRMPLQTSNDTEWLRQNTFVTLEDSAKTYLLRLTDKLYVGEEMPFEIARPEIVNVMENGMQISTLKRIEHELYQDGVKRGDIYLKETRSFEELLSLLPQEPVVSIESQQPINAGTEKSINPNRNENPTTNRQPATNQINPAPTPQKQFQQTQNAPQPVNAQPQPAPAQPAPAQQTPAQQQPAQQQQQQGAVFDYDIFD